MRAKQSLLGVLVVVVLVIVGVVAFVVRTRNETIRMQSQLEAEFRAVALMPGSTLLSVQSRPQVRIAHVAADYSTSVDEATIRAFYRRALSEQGWNVTETERDPCSTCRRPILEFSKGEFRASLELCPNGLDCGWTYGLDFSWPK